MNEIDRETMDYLQDVFDERYMHRLDCSKEQERVNKKFANDDKRIDMIQAKIRLFEKLAYIIATASVGSLVTQIAGLLLK